tara:strand:+ start:1933 stop:2601 length:669 start_codon:yes stop_codon:yes gene_type:complete
MINTKKCSEEEWEAAQNTEFSVWGGFNVGDGDDWSEYWKENINNYDDIKGKHFANVIEVGCGPFGKNLTRVIDLITYEKLYALDPLLKNYCANGRSGIFKMCKNLNIEQLSIPLEDYTSHKNKMDLIICNNVLDHCYDADICFKNIYESLRSGGVLIFGNDLKDESDIATARDTMHPIMLQEDYLKEKFSSYTTIFEKIIPRKECRNKVHCCGCVFTVLRKK